MNKQTFDYYDKQVEFGVEENEIMVNATEMGKVFGKRPVDFLRLASTKDYIEELKTAFTAFRSEDSSLLNAVNDDLPSKNTPKKAESSLLKPIEIVKPEKGKGEDGGVTWMHSRLAIKFAAWLDVKFELWVYDTVHKVTFGYLKEVNEEIKAKAILLNRKSELETKMINQPDFREYLEVLEKIRKSSYKISKSNGAQLSFFR